VTHAVGLYFTHSSLQLISVEVSLILRFLGAGLPVGPAESVVDEMQDVGVELEALHPDVLAAVVSWLHSPRDFSRLVCTSNLFWGGSVVCDGLAIRAARAGRRLLWMRPPSEKSLIQWLLWQERRLLGNILSIVSSWRYHEAMLRADGRLLTRGVCTTPVLIGRGPNDFNPAVFQRVTELHNP
jgi:hypothetical protein